MDPWETLQLRAEGMLKGTQRILDEGGCPVAVDGVRDAIHAILDVCRKQRKGIASDRLTTLPTNGREGDETVAAQVDRMVARMETSGSLPVEPAEAPTYPFLPEHLAAMYHMNHPTGED